MKRITVRKIHPRSGVSPSGQWPAKKVRIEIIKTLRPPILLPSHPTRYRARTEATPEESRISTDWP